MYMRPFEDFGDDFKLKIPAHKPNKIGSTTAPFRKSSPSPPQTYVPDYRPVIKALKELVRAFEVIENRGTTPLNVSEEEKKKRRERAKKRWAEVPSEKRKANTAAARAARRKTAKGMVPWPRAFTVPTQN